MEKITDSVACGDLRGVKTIEYRSRPTRIIGERFYIYAARKTGIEASRHRGFNPLVP